MTEMAEMADTETPEDLMPKAIKKAVDVPTSGNELARLLDEKIEIYPYRTINRFNSIEELLEPYGRVILLYETENQMGHWVGIFYRTKNGKPNKKVIEHFDSYSYKPDDELDFIPKDFAYEAYPKDPINGKPAAHLSKLLLEFQEKGGEVRYSQYRLQGKDSSVCGRWVVCRLLLSDFSEDNFAKFFKKLSKVTKMPKDEIVTVLTSMPFGH